jgi:hypothetical protein
MKNSYNLKIKIRDFVLPKVSYKIGFREKIAALVSPEPTYTITMRDGGDPTKLSCLTVDEKDELISSHFYKGNTPKKGQILRLDVFLPGIATGMVYGVHNLPVREVKRISRNLSEVIVDAEDVDWEGRLKK